MSQDRARAIGEQVVAFLRDALEARVPERDIPRAEAIRRKMLEALPDGDDQAAWRAWREAVAEPIVEAFSGAAGRWDPIVDLVSIYFFSLRTASSHPLAHPTETITESDGITKKPIRLDLGSFVLTGLFRAAPGSRQRFFEEMKSWNVIRSLSPIVRCLELDPHEASALIRRVEALTRNDLAASELIKQLGTWISEHPATGRRIVDGWLDGEPWAKGLDIPAIKILVETVTRAGAEQRKWRDRIIERLEQKNDESMWALCVWLACFAWPEPKPSARERHDALIGQVLRLPNRLLDHGLQAIVRDAWGHPAEAIETAGRLIEIGKQAGPWDANSMQRRAMQVAGIAWRAVREVREHSLPVPDLRPLLEALVSVPPSASRWDLDALLDELELVAPALVQEILALWMAAHERELHEQHLSFDEAFQAFSHRLGVEGVARYLLGFMVSPNAVTRRVAAGFLSRTRQVLAPKGFLERLSPSEVDGLAHELFGTGIDPSVSVPLLFHIADRRPDRIDAVQEILMEDIAEDYPDACRNAALKLPASADGDAQRLAQLRCKILARLDEADALYRMARHTAELSALRPGRHAWHEIQNRIFQESERDARQSGRYIFLALVPRVPFARGEAIAPSSPGEEPARFESYSGAIELPRRELIDPFRFRYRRLWHRHQAEMLLSIKEQP